MDSEGRRDDNEERIFQQHTRKRSIDLAERKHFRYQKYRRSDEEEEAVVVPDIDEHRLTIQQLEEKLETNIETGLSVNERKQRLLKYGPNSVAPPKEPPEFVKFLNELRGWFSLLLLAGSVLSVVGFALNPGTLDNLYIAIILFIVVIINGLFTYFQKRRSSNVMAKFKVLLAAKAKVYIDGQITEVNVESLVPGDVVHLEGGNKVPADVRLVECNGLKVDNSSLTGESLPITCTVEMSDENPFDSTNLCFKSANVTEGNGKAVVFATGEKTMIGQIAKLASEAKVDRTTFEIEMNRFIIIICIFAGIQGVILFVVGMVITRDFITNLIFVIGIIVANVPEGLLGTVTICLTSTAKRLAKKNVLVKNLNIIETLGSTTVICTDKTGTLTQNIMTVSHMWYNLQIFTCGTTLDESNFNKEDPTFKALQRVATLCSRAEFVAEDMDKPAKLRRTTGDATETALIKFFDEIRPISEFREKNPRIFFVPFNSRTKFSVSVHIQEDKNDKRVLLLVKGAPEKIIHYCDTILIDGQEVPLDEAVQEKFLDAYESLGGMGERALGFCQAYLDPVRFPSNYPFREDNARYNFPVRHGLCFVGLISLIDPPKPEVPTAVGKCKEAGIKIIMVTGDHPTTAKAIAQKVGIISRDTVEDIARKEGVPVQEIDPRRAKAIVLHGQDINDLTDEQWDEILEHEQIVFARTTPQQKRIIVEQNQRKKQIVAVTGDGVNDSPALKKANIGISMGISGADVSKEAADIVLLDDNFASIVNGIEEGRLLFDNLKKSIAYTMSHILAEIVPFIVFLFVGIPLPISTLLVLSIDLGIEMVPAMSFAYEKAEAFIMHRPPRNMETDRLVTSTLLAYSYLQIGILQTLAAFYNYIVAMGMEEISPMMLPGLALDFGDTSPSLVVGLGPLQRELILERAQTAYWAGIVIVQMANLYVCRTRKLSIFTQGILSNPWQLGASLWQIVLFIIFVYVPGVQQVFGTRPLPIQLIVTVLPFFVLVFLYDETRKALIRWSGPNGFFTRFFYY